MRTTKAHCRLCGWHALSNTETALVDMAREHQQAVGHIVTIQVPEGWFAWGTYDMYPLPEITERERRYSERLADGWNRAYRYNGD